MVRCLLALAAGLTLLAGCGGSGAPQAAQLAREIPGCHKPFTPAGGIAVQASTEQECLTPAAEVFVATFTSASLQRQWIIAQQPGACGAVRGSGWAAVALATTAVGGFCQAEHAVAKALGGQIVSG